jgi:hypothetical protein
MGPVAVGLIRLLASAYVLTFVVLQYSKILHTSTSIPYVRTCACLLLRLHMRACSSALATAAATGHVLQSTTRHVAPSRVMPAAVHDAGLVSGLHVPRVMLHTAQGLAWFWVYMTHWGFVMAMVYFAAGGSARRTALNRAACRALHARTAVCDLFRYRRRTLHCRPSNISRCRLHVVTLSAACFAPWPSGLLPGVLRAAASHAWVDSRRLRRLTSALQLLAVPWEVRAT